MILKNTFKINDDTAWLKIGHKDEYVRLYINRKSAGTKYKAKRDNSVKYAVLCQRVHDEFKSLYESGMAYGGIIRVLAAKEWKIEEFTL